ncbi:ubiquitin carboxyl-terminal hydrolase 5/13 [Nematocida sp. LUAm3]|nr:ubiquitin carboxyl-terminal hydrolase 5/13 [Nematocida sp. LUAm3]KAI5175984.1 ubiquitin carboxyl-terminal hydrolase 5/13 [Nematocida sp. LUAm2]KAI5179080.1 ubiquitin carboxyl-terminal hydrolase 5/13 [Nematocida sp. LUAm1]
MFNILEFKGECCFCYGSIREAPITLCECSTEYCERHREKHLFSHSSVTIEIRDENIEIIGEVEDKEKMKEELKRKLDSPREIKKICKHINSNLSPVKLKEKICKNCEVSNNTWLCLFCGDSFCGRVQYGIEGNGHFLQHYKETDHFLALRIESLDKKKNSAEFFCYLCDDLIENKNLLDLIISDNQINSSSLKEIEERINTQTQEPEEIEKFPYLQLGKGGISNLGNTCYISAPLIAISFSLKNHLKRLKSFPGTDQCDLPRKCFACQLQKAIKRAQTPSNASFSIEDLWHCIESIYPKYSLNIQQDASEFLEDLLSTVEVYDSIGHFSMLSELFKIEVTITTKCSNCPLSTTEKETRKIFYLQSKPINESVTETEELIASCSCGANSKKRTSAVTHLPPVLLVQQSQQQKNAPPPHLSISHKNYHLAATLLYKGTTNAGHYAAQVRGIAAQYAAHNTPQDTSQDAERDTSRDAPHGAECDDDAHRKRQKHSASSESLDDSGDWLIFDDELVGKSTTLLSEWVTLMFYVMDTT